jgi:uncharacterized protein
MDITGTYTFNAPPERVWNLLMDPAALAGCIPGCEQLAPAGEDRYTARLNVSLAAITGTYEGTVIISDKKPFESYALTVEGQGKPGMVKGSVVISLRPAGEGTEVSVAGGVQTGGMIARLGQRLIGGVSKMMQDRFFACLASKV